jgi:tRNA threonylcarbamoyladenosine biosynthesis protein TsaB
VSPPLLLLDAAFAVPYAAVVRQGRAVAVEKAGPDSPFSAQCVLMAEKCLISAGFSLGDVRGFIFNVGPGSFTGVRVALSALKGLCFGKEAQAVGLNSLYLLARPFFGQGRNVCPVMNAYMGQVYTALYGSKGEEIRPPCAVAPEEAVRLAGAGALVTGDEGAAAPSYDEIIQGAAMAGFERFGAGQTVPVRSLAPLYLRKSYAEIRRDNQRLT